MNLIKLTNKNEITHNILKWGSGVTHSVKKTKNPQLCTESVIHAYKHLNLAILINPCGAHYDPFRIFKAKGDVVVEDWGKVGCFKLETVKEINIPEWYLDKNKLKNISVYFAILCAETVLHIYEDKYPKDDRPRKAIEAAKQYFKTPTDRAADASANAADAAARASANAADAADAAADAADAADAAADAADAAADAAYASYSANAAYAAARAAARAAYASYSAYATRADDASYSANAAYAARAADASYSADAAYASANAAYAARAADAANAAADAAGKQKINFGKLADQAVKKYG